MTDTEQDRSTTSIKIKSANPRWVLEQAGYFQHPAKRGWVKKDGHNRFHAYYSDCIIDLHYDRYKNGRHISHLVEKTFEEARILTGINNGTITHANFEVCDKLPLLERDVEFIGSRLRPRPRWFPRFLYRRLVRFIFDFT